tara:strand:+ start:244 stop:348 length:105 start_codon:yes stop_codon:yes gene_type:complete
MESVTHVEPQYIDDGGGDGGGGDGGGDGGVPQTS